MFGATCMIQAHETGKTWSKTEIRVIRAENVLTENDLDCESLVLFAMLAGGDCDTAGLPNCGPKTAGVVARKQHGLAHALCQAPGHGLPAWRLQLEESLRQAGKRISGPAIFPNMKALGHSRSPTVSSDHQLHNLNCLKYGWDPQIDQAKLRILLRQRFNIWTKGYMTYVAPIFMIRQLARCLPRDEALTDNMKYDIELKKTRKKKSTPDDDDAQPAVLERKVTFYPLPAVDFNVFEQPESEDWSIWEKNSSRYDPAGHIECKVLSCFLEHGLPKEHLTGYLTASEPQQRQTSRNVSAAAVEQGTTNSISAVAPGDNLQTDTAGGGATKKRGRPKKASAQA